MALSVTLVSGPRRSGKSLIAGLLIDEVLERRPHYVRLSAVNGGKRPPVGIPPPKEGCAVASAHWLCYECERVFEALPEMLASIYRRDRQGRVVIEADADPALRLAYPYDHQVFVMPAPASLESVFRSSNQAARALQDALDDTAEFALEVFGVSQDDGSLDDDTREERELLTRSQIRRFLDSPLGDQLATRLQLQPQYHGLVECDLVVINTTAGGPPQAWDTQIECRRRLESLLARVGAPAAMRGTVFLCDPADQDDPERQDLIRSLRTVCLQDA